MVSIIIPTYNYGRFITEALESVRQQTYTDFECIIVDNGSGDDTRSLVAPFLKDQRFRYLYIANKGVANARNTGLTMALGEYVQFLDADDLIQSDKLQVAVSWLQSHPETDLVYSGMRYFKDGNRETLFHNYQCIAGRDNEWMPKISGKGSDLVKQLLDGNVMVISSPVTRMKTLTLLSFFDPALRYNEDWDLWLRMALTDAKFQYLDRPDSLSLIRIHENSASRDSFRMQVNGLKVLLKNEKAIRNYRLADKLESRIKEHVRLLRDGLLACESAEFTNKVAFLRENGIFKLLFRVNSSMTWLLKLSLRVLPAKKVTL